MGDYSIIREVQMLAAFTGLSPGQFRHVFWGDRAPLNGSGQVTIGWTPEPNSQWILTKVKGVAYDGLGRAVDVATTCRISYAGTGVLASHTLTQEERALLMVFTGGQRINFELTAARFQGDMEYQISTSGYLVSDMQTVLEAFQTQIIQTAPVIPPPFTT
jgi:hypothetical protein